MIPSLKYYLSSKLYLLMSLLLLNIFTRSIRFYNIHKHSYKTTFLKVQSSCCLAPLLCYHVEYLLCYHVDYLIVLGVVSLSHSRCSNACIPDHLHWYTTLDLSLTFCIIASNAQSPVPGFEEPCLISMPCF